MIIESFMYFGIGFLLAALGVLVVAPLVHDRAVRLTARRLEASIPLSMAEVQADKDLLRAEFALSTRRLETNVEQLRAKNAGQLADLGRKGDAINRLNAEVSTLREQLHASEEEMAAKTDAAVKAQRQLSKKEEELAKLTSDLNQRSDIADAQKGEILAIRTRLEQLQERLTVAANEVRAEGSAARFVPKVPLDSLQGSSERQHEDDIPLVPKAWPTAELGPLPTDSSPPKDRLTAQAGKAALDSSHRPPQKHQHHEGGVVPVVPEDWRTAKLGAAPMESSQSPPPNSRHEGNSIPLVPKVSPTAEQEASPRHSSQNDRHEGVPVAPNDVRADELGGDVVPIVPEDWSTAKLGKLPMDSSRSPPNRQRIEADVFPFVPKARPKAEDDLSSGGPVPDHDAGRHASEQSVRTAREGSNFAELRTSEPSIHVFPRPSNNFTNGQFASNKASNGRRTFRALARVSLAALIGVGGLSIWRSHGDEARETIKVWVPTWFSSIPTAKSPSVPTPTATSPELTQQLEAIPRDLTAMQRSVEQLTEQQKQTARNIATLQAAEQNIKKKTSLSSHLRRREKLTAWPETRPTTIPGWTLRGITDGTAILEGPNGVFRAMRGDTVPGVGRVESMVRWGNRLIVATSTGLISTP